MDPVTAFSLAAGVLQVVDLSLKALGRCREIYKDGSLAQHRQTEEITKSLADTSERLQSSDHFAPTALSEESKDVIDLSEKCSATAEALLSELRKLQLHPRDNFLKAVKTGVRAFRSKKFLTETEAKLQKYQTILNTRILSRLDVHAIWQIEKSQQLDQRVKNLAQALAEGRNTVKQLLSDQTGIIEGHIDRQFVNQAQREAKQRTRREFKKTLFFPEILARRDNIVKSHEGTCRWILKPLNQRSRLDDYQARDDDLASDDDLTSDDDLASDDDWGGDITEMRVRPESNFVEWLKKGESIYWLNGKPGAGKSTLMKYISTNVPRLHRSGQLLSDYGTEADFMACSFFFWSPGVSLQKNYVGFVRSLLYQIAEQRDDAVPVMMGNSAASTEDGGTSDAEGSAPSHMWTIERLDDALRRFLAKKPAALRFYVFIDGLDEFDGDEDPLLQTVRLLAGTPGTRVCVSSRPEQIFRQGFANSPQLKLQDFNHHDIEKASHDQLEAVLAQYFPDSHGKSHLLIWDVARKSSGIFLWADLMNKIIKRGAINGDTIEELRKRLDHTPDTIDGLYQDMLTRLDKEYLQDAARYMQMLLVDGEQRYQKGLTLLHFACLEQSTQDHKTSGVARYDQSTDFDEICRQLETRILVRCGGLVEIDEFLRHGALDAIYTLGIRVSTGRVADEADLNVNGAPGNITRNLRFVRFIHKTAADFARKYDKFVKDPKWTLTATLDVTRAKIEGLALTPLVLQQSVLMEYKLRLWIDFLRGVMWPLPLLETQWPVEEDHELIRNLAFDTINRTFDIADYVNTSLVPTFSSRSHVHENLINMPYHINRVGCAAWFGCHDYVIRYVMPGICSEEVTEKILDCALDGFKTWVFYPASEPMITGLLRIMFDFVPQSRSKFWHDCRSDENGLPRWREFIDLSSSPVARFLLEDDSEDRLLQKNSQFLTTSRHVLKAILDHNVDVNHLLPLTLKSRGPVHDDETQIRIPGEWMVVKMRESVLSTLKRKFTSLDPVLAKEVGSPNPVFAENVIKVLEAHGATDYKDSFRIGIHGRDTRDGFPLYQLTHAQSEK